MRVMAVRTAIASGSERFLRQVVSAGVLAASEAVYVLNVCVYQVLGTPAGVRGRCCGPLKYFGWQNGLFVAAGNLRLRPPPPNPSQKAVDARHPQKMLTLTARQNPGFSVK